MADLAVEYVDPDSGETWGETLAAPEDPGAARYRGEHVGTITWDETPPDVSGVDEPYQSHIFLTENGRLRGDSIWSMAATVGASRRGWGYILVNEYYRDHMAFTLLHELGHNAGYGHDAGGVMGHRRRDMAEEGTLHETTRRIAEQVQGYQVIDWADPGLATLWVSKLVDSWRRGACSNEDYLYAVRMWRQSQGECIFASSSLRDDLEAGLRAYPHNPYADYFSNDDRQFWSGGFYRGGVDRGRHWGNHRWNLFDPPDWDPV